MLTQNHKQAFLRQFTHIHTHKKTNNKIKHQENILLWKISVWDANHHKLKIHTGARDKPKSMHKTLGSQLCGNLQHSEEEHAEGLLSRHSFTDRHVRFRIICSKPTASAWCQHCKQSMLHNHAPTPLVEKWKSKRLSLKCRFLGEDYPYLYIFC